MHSLRTRAGTARHGGFTLVELAITLLVLTVLTSLLLIPLSGREEIRHRQQTSAELQEIRDALIGFAIIHRRLPCPAYQSDPAAGNYGLEDTSGSSCPQSSEGFLPWRTLGLPATDSWGVERTSQSDAWTGYWRYRVDPAFGDPGASISVTTTASLDLNLREVPSGTDMVAAKTVVAIVYSTGPNRSADGENASYEPGDATYNHGAPTTGFDDLVIWISHPLLLARLAAAGTLQ